MALVEPEQPIHDVLDQVLGYLNFSSGNHDPKFFSNLNLLFDFYRERVQEGSSARKKRSAPRLAWHTNSEHDLAQRVGKALAESFGRSFPTKTRRFGTLRNPKPRLS